MPVLNSLVQWCVANCSNAWQSIINVGVALVAVLGFVHTALVVLENFWPGLKTADGTVQKVIMFLDKWVHGSGAWDGQKAATAAPPKAPAVSLANTIQKGFIGLHLLPLLTAGALAALVFGGGCATWSAAPSFSAGPSIPLTAFYPGAVHPVSVANGAGVEGAIGFAPAAIYGKQFDLLTGSLQLYGVVSAPAGVPVGGVSAAAMLGTLNNTIAAGPICPIANADGSGCATGKGCSCGVALAFSFPLNISTSPPVGISPGVRGLQRGGWSDIWGAVFGPR